MREPRSGDTFSGKHGSYTLREPLDKGGNGQVWTLNIKDVFSKGISPGEEYVVKILLLDGKSQKEQKKRIERFRIEAQFLHDNELPNTIPIIDSSLLCDNLLNGCEWYIMPKAEKYDCRKGRMLEEILSDFLEIGKTLQILHSKAKAHRDIKPKNLLLYKGKLCLSDYGLLWDLEDDRQITQTGDWIGPSSIRPPEMDNADPEQRIDYRKSDVYLFAKTLWCAICGDTRGFREEYSRADRRICYSKENTGFFDTLEPLHCMMEAATRYYYEERIDIDKCIDYIVIQIKICQGTLHSDVLSELRYNEAIKAVKASVETDTLLYSSGAKITRILNAMSNRANLFYVENEEGFVVGKMRGANIIGNNEFLLHINEPISIWNRTGKRDIVMKIASLKIDDDNNCIIETMTEADKEHRQVMNLGLTEALRTTDPIVTIDGNYTLELKPV